jgi:hypothetical protein
MKWLLAFALVACSSKQTTPNNGSGVGNGTNEPVSGCDAAKSKIEQLYRDEAAANKEKPERVEEAVSDNTKMVMNECVKSPEKVSGCVKRAKTAGELEKQCLAQLDDEGTEGEALRK